ncbi:hypothetical protein TRIUR3_25325 [Triticum urartu]|uniref:UspA domain-containing protein n=2 Tax=Triticum TaxID=4564 RepID=A0A9R1NQB5_TRITD|nr:hypothetical protein TRIUR3_25325 [Triticum urartu]VAH29146.1 unnamed protein product [Triticum turgidum subsp. durum]
MERYYRVELLLYYRPFTETKQQAKMRAALNCGRASSVSSSSFSPFPTILPSKGENPSLTSTVQRRWVKAPTPRPPPPASLQPDSPGVFFTNAAAAAPLGSAHRRIAIAVDLSDESAYAVSWAVANYLRPGDAVILLHVRSTNVLYGADWGSVTPTSPEDDAEVAARKMEEDFDALTASKADDLAKPLEEAKIPYKIHIVKDHDMKERLCLEVERLGLSAVIMGSKGFGAARRASKGRLGSVSDYCVHHCICPVVVVRSPDDAVAEGGESATTMEAAVGADDVLHPVPEEDAEYHDAAEEHKGNCFYTFTSVFD